MSLLEEWQTQETGRITGDSLGDEAGERGAFGEFDDDGLAPPPGAGEVAGEAPIFSLEPVERGIARGRGQVTAAAAANNVVAVVTSRGWLLRYDLAQSATPITELELAKGPDVQATGVWADPTGSQLVIAALTPAGWEAFLWHARWKKCRPITKLTKGAQLTAAAWNPGTATPAASGDVALGTAGGSVLCLSFGEKEGKEKGGKPVLQLPDPAGPLLGLRQVPLQERRLLLLAATPARLHCFVGPETLECLGAAYPASAGLANFIELPPTHPCGSLATFANPGEGSAPARFAWLAGPGLYRGGFDLGSAAESPNELEALGQHNLLPLPVTPGLEERPIAVAQTEFHEIVLYPSRLQALNRVSQGLAQELPLGGGAVAGGRPIGFVEDGETGALFLFTADGLAEVVAAGEGRDVWRAHLERREWASARRACRSQAQRDAVAHAEAAAAFAAGKLAEAARLWGSCVTAAPPGFEEVALRFVEAGSPEALRAFLGARLAALPSSDKAQATMVATWLTELLLDSINRALLEAGDDSSVSRDGGEAALPDRDESASARLAQLQEELREFLRENVGVLDAKTTVGLLASYGRTDDLEHFAACRQDSEALLEHLLARGDPSKALALLRRPDVSAELFYRFAPALMAQAPGETVDACIAANPALDPRRLLPALLRFADPGTPPAARRHALRYVTHCLGSPAAAAEPAVHQLAVALLCSQGDEEALLGYLASARDPLGRPQYDPEAALRLARRQGLPRACIELLWELGLFEDAVTLALGLDPAAAARLAHRPQEDEGLQRRLWLAIATHLVRQAAAQGGEGQDGAIAAVNQLMRDAGGLVRIEDVLPLFPDFVRIDAFKEAICASLEEYNAQIEGLKGEMDDATRIADALRRDVGRLEQRTATLDLSEPCASCGRPVGEPPPASVTVTPAAVTAASGGAAAAARGGNPKNPTAAGIGGATGAIPAAGGALPRLLLFPTGNAFHAGCLAGEVCRLAPPERGARIAKLAHALAKTRLPASASPDDEASLPAKARELQQRLRAEIAGEDPFNGELLLAQLDAPFVGEAEAAEVAAWQL